MLFEIRIEPCCSSMKTMIEDGAMKPYVTYNEDKGEMFVRGDNGKLCYYNQVKYCNFCGSKIKVVDR